MTPPIQRKGNQAATRTNAQPEESMDVVQTESVGSAMNIIDEFEKIESDVNLFSREINQTGQQNLTFIEALELLSIARSVEDIKMISPEQLADIMKEIRAEGIKYCIAILEVHVLVMRQHTNREELGTLCKLQSTVTDELKKDFNLKTQADTYENALNAWASLMELRKHAYNVGLELFSVYPECQSIENFKRFIKQVRNLQLGCKENMQLTLFMHQQKVTEKTIEILKKKTKSNMRELKLYAEKLGENYEKPTVYVAFEKTVNDYTIKLSTAQMNPATGGTFSLEHSFKYQQLSVTLQEWVKSWKSNYTG